MGLKTQSKFKKVLFSKVVIALLVVLVVSIGYLEFKQLSKRSKYNKEIEELQKQEQELISKNQALKDSLEYLNNDEYREKIARQQLNLKKDGEIVVNFPPAVSAPAEQDNTNKSETNPKKWWRYFFTNQN